MSPSDQHFFRTLLIEKGLVSPAQVEQCAKLQAAEIEVGKSRRSLGEIMVELGYLTNEQHELALADQRRRLKDVTVGPYEIIDKLGQGGMGVVYRARMPDTNLEVALKLLPKELASDPNFLARFRREANVGMEMNHPHIVRTVDFGESKGTFYLAMEVVEGGTLERHLRHTRTIPERTALKLVRDLLTALQYAHEKGLVHRDIKPSNILFDNEGKSKLSDFGLAKAAEPDPAFMTQGTTVGTPHYMAPEQSRGEAIDIRADLYSLGATLYHCLTGRTPYAGSSASLIMEQQLHREIPPAESINPAISAGCAALIKKLMAKDRTRRYATPAAASEDVARLLRGESPSETVESVPASGQGPAAPLATRPNPASVSRPSSSPRQAPYARAVGVRPSLASPMSPTSPKRSLWWPALLVMACLVWLIGFAIMVAFVRAVNEPLPARTHLVIPPPTAPPTKEPPLAPAPRSAAERP